MFIFVILYGLTGIFTIGIVSSGCNQIETLSKTTFNNGYVLNYPLNIGDEYAFPENAIRFFRIDGTKIVTTCIMELPNTNYTSNSIVRNLTGGALKSNEIIVSHNIAKKYGIKVGDQLTATMPNETDVSIFTVRGICASSYDITNMNLYNDVGIILLGCDREYLSSMNLKYIVFSDHSLSSLIAQNPQSLDGVFSRNELLFDISLQIAPILALYLLLSFIYFVLLNKFVFKESEKQAKVILRKGTKRNEVINFLVIETVFFYLFPCCIILPLWVFVCEANLAVSILLNTAVAGGFCIHRYFIISHLGK